MRGINGLVEANTIQFRQYVYQVIEESGLKSGRLKIAKEILIP